ncbi:uncharacterized protein LOC108089531 [Drosophila ficusphila]|uniref:uncharacterized protein LOC108089531 n=1 Tax=Drosophila ficusphila TaxID=30025 RepID=UPI0007E7732C|nr:uncharacterized protein LOC108089531 [Drosophila ficusphila]
MYPCRFLRRCISCHDRCLCCLRPFCCPRSCSLDTRKCRVVFPGEFQKFSDMVPPSFLLKDPKSSKKKKRSKSCSACKDKCNGRCVDDCKENCEHKNRGDECEPENPEQNSRNGLNDPCKQDGPTGNGACEPGLNGAPGAYGPGFNGAVPTFQPGQPGVVPYYGTCLPAGSPMVFPMIATQYGSYGFPGPQFPLQAQTSMAGQECAPSPSPSGPPAAGLPTKYLDRFNPCTGEVFHYENQQSVTTHNVARGGPPYNQFGQGIGMGCGPNNQCYPFNVAQQTFNPYPVNPMPPALNNPIASQVPQVGNTELQRNVANNQPKQVVSLQTNNQSYKHNVGDKTLYSRQVSQSVASSVRVRENDNRSQSPKKHIETSEGPLGNPTKNREAPYYNQPNNQQYTKNYSNRNIDPRSVSQSKSSSGQGDERPNDPRRRNRSMGAPSSREPQLNTHSNQQNVGMGFNPSNQYYPYNSANCPPMDTTFTVQKDSSNGNHPRQDSKRSRSERNKTSREPSKPPMEEPTTNEPIKCYCTRFSPYNQYYPYYVSEEAEYPPSGNSRSEKDKKQDMECSELLSRAAESCPPCDLQKWCDILMPEHKRKKSTKPPAKKHKKSDERSKSRNKSKRGSSAMEPIADGSTPPVAVEKDQPAEEAPSKDENCSCNCIANLPENQPEPPAQQGEAPPCPPPSCPPQPCPPQSCPQQSCPPASCPANPCCTSCWNPCPWSYYYNPCTGCYYYYANCCNGCRNCCNYCCSPCGSCGNKSPNPPKPTDQKKKPYPTIGSPRKSGGTTVDPKSWLGPPVSGNLTPPPGNFTYPTSPVSTMPGYSRTGPSQFSSPYSGQWQAGGVTIIPTNGLYVQSHVNRSGMRQG